jgi:hypothetical protein
VGIRPGARRNIAFDTIPAKADPAIRKRFESSGTHPRAFDASFGYHCLQPPTINQNHTVTIEVENTDHVPAETSKRLVLDIPNLESEEE